MPVEAKAALQSREGLQLILDLFSDLQLERGVHLEGFQFLLGGVVGVLESPGGRLQQLHLPRGLLQTGSEPGHVLLQRSHRLLELRLQEQLVLLVQPSPIRQSAFNECSSTDKE